VRSGDIIRLDSHKGVLEAQVAQETWQRREAIGADLRHNEFGMGRELFATFRQLASDAESGAITCMSVRDSIASMMTIAANALA
jgi:phosphogluconate dehydratase